MLSRIQALLYKQQFCQSASQSLTDVNTSNFPLGEAGFMFLLLMLPNLLSSPQSILTAVPRCSCPAWNLWTLLYAGQPFTLVQCSAVHLRIVHCSTFLEQYTAVHFTIVHNSAVHCSAFLEVHYSAVHLKQQTTVQCRVSSMGILPDATDKTTQCCAVLPYIAAHTFTALHCTALHCTALHGNTLHNTALQC